MNGLPDMNNLPDLQRLVPQYPSSASHITRTKKQRGAYGSWMRFLWISFGISMVLVIVDDKNGKNAWTVVASVIAFTLLLVSAFLFRFLPWEGRMIDQALKPIPTEGQIYDEFKRRAGRPPTPAEIAVIQNKIRNEKLTAAAAVIAALGGFALGAHLSKGGKL